MKRLGLLLALTACAPQQPVFKPVVVDVPVTVPCHAAAVAKPDFAVAHSGAGDGIFEKTKAVLEELDQRKAYEELLLRNGCAG